MSSANDGLHAVISMNRNKLGKLAILVFVTGLMDVTVPVIAAERAEDVLQDRFAIVDQLLNDSSAAHKVEDSNVVAAKELYATALENYAAARQAYESGDTDSAESGLSEATRLMYAAVSATRDRGNETEKYDRDFRNRRESIEALLAAHQRVTTEKGQERDHELLEQEVTASLDNAEELLATGQPERARRLLDAAYDIVKLAVRQLRDGDTLVRELKFETKKDEYLYELQSNDTYRMLVVVLLEERLADERVKDRVTPLIAAAEELRDVAESQAADGQFSEAVETLERSKKEFVKAIRSAGVYIPG